MLTHATTPAPTPLRASSATDIRENFPFGQNICGPQQMFEHAPVCLHCRAIPCRIAASRVDHKTIK